MSIIYFHNCAIFESQTKHKLITNNSNLVIYSTEKSPADPNPSRIQPDLEFLRKFFEGMEKENSYKSAFQDSRFISPREAEELAFEIGKIFQSDEKIKKLYIILKRNDPISPLTRIYRTRFYLSLEKNSLYFQIIELDSYMIFSDQYKFWDWAAPDFPKPACQKNQSIGFSQEYTNNILFLNDGQCINQELMNTERSGPVNYYKFHVFLEALPAKEQLGKDLTLSGKLKELEEMRKLRLISEKEYMEKRKKILDKL